MTPLHVVNDYDDFATSENSSYFKITTSKYSIIYWRDPDTYLYIRKHIVDAFIPLYKFNMKLDMNYFSESQEKFESNEKFINNRIENIIKLAVFL